MKLRSLAFFLFAFICFFITSSFDADAQTYVVKKGDSLYRIAKKLGIDSDRIREANNLDSTRLRPGTKLIIPSNLPTRTQADSPGRTGQAGEPSENKNASKHGENVSVKSTLSHTVKKGDTLASLSKKYSVSVSALKELNNIGKSSKLKIGQRLLVAGTGPRTYAVRKGDNLSKIARKFDVGADDLRELNELGSDELKPGQRLLLEERVEQPAMKNHPMPSRAMVSEDIKTLTESPELDSLGMKDRLTLFARKMLDIPYRFGGSTFMGIDCSGYVQKVFGFLDIPLPRTAREQFDIGEPVAREELSIGDLVFFRTYASFPSHVGIYLGNNLFIHASSRSRKVSIDSLDTPYYIKRFIGAKRLFLDELDETREYKEKG